jgi:hypothetical protein
MIGAIVAFAMLASPVASNELGVNYLQEGADFMCHDVFGGEWEGTVTMTSGGKESQNTRTLPYCNKGPYELVDGLAGGLLSRIAN